MDGLLLVERAILESLVRGRESVDEIVCDTSLGRKIVSNTLDSLGKRLFVGSTEDLKRYWVDVDNLKQKVSNVNMPKNIWGEIQDTLLAAIRSNFYFSESGDQWPGMKKLWLSSDEEMILYSLFKRLDDFFTKVNSFQEERSHKQYLFEKEVIFWGHVKYGQVVNHSLHEE